MQIHCCFTPAHAVLFEQFFQPSLPAGFDLKATALPLDGPGDFLSPEFLACIRRKIQLIRTSLADNEEKILVWSDVDIRFYQPVASELKDLLDHSGTPLLFQKEGREGREVNTGFFVCRATPEVDRIFAAVEYRLASDPDWNEQRAVNHLIANGELTRFGYLPMTYYARTHGWPPPRDLRIYHANYTTSAGGVEQKIAQFRETDEALAGGWRRWRSLFRTARKLGPAGLVATARRRLR